MRIVTAPSDRIMLDDRSDHWNADECNSTIARIASALQGAGLVAGETVALLSRNTADYPLWLMGAVAAGLWVVPVNWHLKSDEIRHILHDSEARLVLMDPSLAFELPPIPCWMLDAARKQQICHASPAVLSTETVAGGIMLYTSGTTGLPKGVRRAQPATLGALLHDWRQRGRAVGLDGSGPHLVTGPLYHAAPLLYALYDWINGAPMLIMRQFDAGLALDWIEQARVRHTHWVPTMFVRALRLPASRRDAADVSSLDLVLHGAAPIATPLKRQMIKWWGPVLVEYWGGSESGAVTRVTAEVWQDHPGTVGQALPGFEVYAVDPQGQRLPSGEHGRLAVQSRSGGRIFEYYRDVEKTNSSHCGDALLLGDIGYVDDDGYVYLLDREGHTIISGGVNIYPAEVEAVLSSHPLVADVIVRGEPDSEWGERVIAQVVPDAAASRHQSRESMASKLLEFAAEQLANYKLPRRIDWVEQLPRTDTGKMYRRNLG